MHKLSSFYLVATIILGLVAFIHANPWNYTNQAGVTNCHAGSYFAPSSTAEVQQIINDARANGQKVKALGSVHSLPSIVCVEEGGIAVWLGNMKEVKEINVAAGYAVAEAGITVTELQLALADAGGAMEHTPQYGAITMGGALGTGAHGSTWSTPTALADQVLSITLVNAHGNVVVIDDPVQLTRSVVHMGLLGIVVEVKMKIEPLFKVLAEKVILPSEVVLNGSVLDMARQYDFFTVNWMPYLNKAIILRYTKVPASTPGNDYWGLFDREDLGDIFGGLEAAAALKDVNLQCQVAEMEFSWYNNGTLFKSFDDPEGNPVNPAIGYPYQILSSLGPAPCVGPQCELDVVFPVFDASFAVPENKFVAAANFIRDLVNEQKFCFVFNGGIFMRFLKGTNNVMSFHNEGDAVMFEYIPLLRVDHPDETVRLRLDLQQEIDQALIGKFKSKPHWGKNGDSSFIRAKTMYRHRHRFLAIRHQMDPFGMFDNEFARIVFNNQQIPNTPLCAMYGRCICRFGPHDQSCAAHQTCERGYEYKRARVCREPLPLGTACKKNSDCFSGNCCSEVCV